MAVDSKTKSTEFTSAVTIVTAEWANSHYITEIAEGHTGHVHDGDLADGHAGKVLLTTGAHVRGQLPHANLADVAVQKRNVQTYPIGQIYHAIPVSVEVEGVKQYYLDLSLFEPAGDDKNIQYNHSGLLGAESGFSWDYTNNRLGIGTDSPVYKVHIVANDNTASLGITDRDDSGGAPDIRLRTARGGATPTACQEDDPFGWIFGLGYDGSQYEIGAGIVMRADSPVSSADVSGRIQFYARPAGATGILLGDTSAHLRMTIKNDGKVGIGIAEPTALLHVDGSAIIEGDLTVNGTTTTLNTTEMTVDDPNIELNAIGSSATDTLADGGGITLHGSGSSVYTIAWANATNRWHFNQGIEIDGTDTNLIVGGDSPGAGSNQIGLRTDSPAFPFHMQNSDQLIAHNEPADAGCKSIQFRKSKGAVGVYTDHTIVGTDDKLGAIRFFGADGTQYVEAANIVSLIDDLVTPVAQNDMPGMLVFETTSAGSNSPSERVRISSKGHVGIGLAEGGGTEVLRRLDVQGPDAANTTPVRIREIPQGMGKVLVWDQYGDMGSAPNNLAGDVYWAPIEFFESTEEAPATVEVTGPVNEDAAVVINPTSGGYDADGIELMFYSVHSGERRPFNVNKFGNLGVGKINAGQTYRIDADGVMNATGIAINGVALTASIGQLNDAGVQTPAAGGTAEANKAVVLDSNKDIVGLRDQKLEGDIHFTNNTKGIKDSNGNYQAKFNQVADAVNNVELSNAATGGAPVLAASGADANVGLTLGTQGTGDHVFRHANQDTLAIKNDSGNVVYQQRVAGKDHVFKAQDGVEALRIKSDGNVGIGIASPNDYVDEKRNLVLGSTTAHTGMTIVSGPTHIGTIQFRSDTAVNSIEGWVDYSQNSKAMRFGTNGLNTRMVIDSSGNVGIGIASPNDYVDEKRNLVIGATTGHTGMTIASGNTSIGTIQFRGNTAVNDTEGWIDYSNNLKTMRFGTNGLNTRMVIDSSGNVGIGSPNPSTALDVSGTVTATVLQAGNIKVNANIISSTNTNGDMALIPNGSGKVIIGGLNWPTVDGSNGHVLSTDGGGNLTFTAASGGLSNVVEDTSPQLGANLDVQTFDITTSANNGNVHLKPNGLGRVSVGTGSGEAKVTSEGAYHLVLETNEGTNSGFIKIGSGLNGNIEIIPNGNGVVKLDNDQWPISSGTNGQVLTALGSGALGWGAAGMTSVLTDTSPQLGGDLDVNGAKIVSTSGGDIAFVTDAAGNVVFKNNQNDGNRTELQIYDQDNGHFTAIRAAQDIASNFTLTLPSAVGTAGQALVTDNSGNLSWSAVGGTTTTINSNTDNYVLTGSGSADTIDGEANLLFNGSELTVKGDVHVEHSSSATNQVEHGLVIKHTTSGTPANGIGTGISFNQETADNNFEEFGNLNFYALDVSAGGEDSAFSVKLQNGGAAVSEVLRIEPASAASGVFLPTDAVSLYFGVNADVIMQHLHNTGIDLSATNAQNNGVLGVLNLTAQTANTAVAGMGVGIVATAENASGSNAEMGRLDFAYTDVTGNSEDADFILNLTTNGSVGEKLRVTSAGLVGIGAPNPTNKLHVNGNIGVGGSNNDLRFYEAANYIGFRAPALDANQIWVLPAADGSSGDVLTTAGNGTLSWAASGGLTDVVNDTTPQLGGNLDINGKKIISTSDADIWFIPDGSGKVRADAPLKIAYDDSNHTTITTTSGGMAEIDPTGGSLSVHGSLTAQRKVISIINSNVSLTGVDSGALVVFNSTTGRILTLPDIPSAQDEGMWFDICIIDGPAGESQVHKIRVSDTANTRFKGSVIMFKPSTDNVSFLPGNSDIGLTFNGGTTGRINTTVRVICVAQDKWFIAPSASLVVYTGNAATPFVSS